MHKSRPSTFEFKHKCLDCNSSFKNSILLSKHNCLIKNKNDNKSHQCSICKKIFDSSISLILHKKSHDDDVTNMFARPNGVAKRLTLDKKKAAKDIHDEMGINKPENARKFSVRPSLITKRLPGEHVDGTNKYKCETCNQTFKNGILLKRHVCNSDKINQYNCKLCNLKFKDITVFNMHKKKHIKENLVKSTSEVQISPMKFLSSGKRDLTKSPKKSLNHLKVVHKVSPSFKVSVRN